MSFHDSIRCVICTHFYISIRSEYLYTSVMTFNRVAGLTVLLVDDLWQRRLSVSTTGDEPAAFGPLNRVTAACLACVSSCSPDSVAWSQLVREKAGCVSTKMKKSQANCAANAN